MRHDIRIQQAGDRLRDYALTHDIGPTEIHKRTGVARSTIYEFMYNNRDISSARLAKICGCLNISMDYICGLKNKA